MSEWIDVKQEMPKFVGEYLAMKYTRNCLIFSSKVGISVAHFCSEHDGYKTYWQAAKSHPIKVTHWMPLPEPPPSPNPSSIEERR